VCCAVVLVVGGLFVACNKGSSEEESKSTEMQQQATEIQELYQQIVDARDELASARARVEELEAIDAGKRSEEEQAELDELTARIPALEEEVARIDELNGKLAQFLTTALNEFPDAAETQVALEIYSKEAIRNAAEYVEKAGKYADAIDILSTAKGYYEAIGAAPYPPLVEVIAEYEDWRFVPKERFDELKKGMTMDEVKETIGVPYYANIQVDEKAGVETWLYRHREGGAAAVYFKTKSGKAYGFKWDAVKPKVVED
jgi:hypothetical protein